LRHHAGCALAISGLRSEHPHVSRMLACGPYRASRDQPERAPEYWWSAGTAPLLVIQGLDDIVAPPANGHALRDQLGERSQVVDMPGAGHVVIVEQPDLVTAAVIDFIGGRRVNPHYRSHHHARGSLP